ncbi:TlpA family protein disulfide reductase [Corynebacterium hindlerae]|uniref:TlpA family protein disulfide reductase n=1 Tax=Corynebacterium hindlerae TaxID=699041 RepID=UPI003B84A19E
MSKTGIWTIVASALILISLVFLVPSMLGSPTKQEEEATPVAARPECPVDTLGKVELPCLGADSHSAQGAPTVVNVWAWWCGPCRQELPLFDALAESHPEWNVVGVHADTNAANGAALLNELGVQLPSFQDDHNTFAGTYGLPGVVPITVVMDKNQQIVQTFPAVFASKAELETAVKEALSR